MDPDNTPSTRQPFEERQVVWKHYHLEKCLGSSSTGQVWLATQLNACDTKVALKFPLLLSAQDERDSLEELRKEACNGMAMSGHPNIVKVFDFLEDAEAPNEPIAIVMEYVEEGDSLKDLLAEKLKTDRCPFSVEEVGALLLPICEGLNCAHFKGKLTHRDLRPANILVGINGAVKITDFGLARSFEIAASRRSSRSVASRSLSYMSPQQAMGRMPCPKDDIYSLGICVFELLTGTVPFLGGSVAEPITDKKAPSVSERLWEIYGARYRPEIPKIWEEAIARCLKKEPEDRPESAGEVASYLGLEDRGLSSVRKVRQKKVSPPKELRPQERSSQATEPRKILVFSGVGAFMATAAIGFWIWHKDFFKQNGTKLPFEVEISRGRIWQPLPPAQAIRNNPIRAALDEFHELSKKMSIPNAHFEANAVPFFRGATPKPLSNNVSSAAESTAEPSAGPKTALASTSPLVSPHAQDLQNGLEVGHLGTKEVSSKTAADLLSVPPTVDAPLPVPAPIVDASGKEPIRAIPITIPEVAQGGPNVNLGPDASTSPVKAGGIVPAGESLSGTSEKNAAESLIEPTTNPNPVLASASLVEPRSSGSTGGAFSNPVSSSTTGSSQLVDVPLSAEKSRTSGNALAMKLGSENHEDQKSVTGDDLYSQDDLDDLDPAAPTSGNWSLKELFAPSEYGGSSAGAQKHVLTVVQQVLKEQGFYTSTIDGAAGTSTEQAIISFQKAHGMPRSGRLYDDMLMALHVKEVLHREKSEQAKPEPGRSDREKGLAAGPPAKPKGLQGNQLLTPQQRLLLQQQKEAHERPSFSDPNKSTADKTLEYLKQVWKRGEDSAR